MIKIKVVTEEMMSVIEFMIVDIAVVTVAIQIMKRKIQRYIFEKYYVLDVFMPPILKYVIVKKIHVIFRDSFSFQH